MLHIVLINMPFGALNLPSLALTQLKAVLDRRYAGRVNTRILHLNHDFASCMGGIEPYNYVLSGDGFMRGVGDWLFRQDAFPETEDNAEAYFGRFYFGDDPDTRTRRELLIRARRALGPFLEALIDRHGLTDADVVGFTSLFAQTVASFALARRLKARRLNITTVMGGAACEDIMGREFARQVRHIDYVFSGPALVSFPAFVGHRLDGPADAPPPPIQGVFSRHVPSTLADADEQTADALGTELDINTAIPLDYTPFLDAVEQTFPGGEVQPTLLFETSRGCSWGERLPCTFCGLNGTQRRYRAMRPENALAQFRALLRHIPRCRIFEAVDNVLPADYPEQVFPHLRPPDGIKILYEVRPTLTDDEIRLLCEAGVREIQPGIESLSSDTLRLMRKGTTAFRNIRFLKTCSRHPILLNWNLLLFTPHEPETSFEKCRQDIPLLTHLPPPTGVYPVNFARYSRYFEDPEAYGLELDPQDFCALTYPFDRAALCNVAYHFVDRGGDTAHQDTWLGTLRASVAFWQRRWLNTDGRGEARLCLVDDGGRTTLYDSRAGTPVECDVDKPTRDLLTFLEQPRTMDEVSRLPHERSSADPSERVRFLREHGLLFEEHGRLLSLVTGSAGH